LKFVFQSQRSRFQPAHKENQMKLQIARMMGIARREAGRIVLVTLAAVLAASCTPLPALAADTGWQLDAGHSTARLFLGSNTDPESLNVGVARVSGRMLLDPYDPARSTFDLVIYPAGGDSRGLDGKLAAGRFPGAAYTEMSFKSKRIVATSDGNLEVTGDLTLTRVDRSVTANPTEDYAGPIYGNPVIHTISHEVTFRFSGVDSPAVSEKKTATTKLSASAGIGYENFPQLSSAILNTNWPLVVEDENCQVASTVGEDYAGHSCTGITVPVISRAAAPSNVGEDYHGFEVAPRAGNQVTIEFDLAGTWSASASQIAGN
jgi:polyisoprenoid-binding protein YceI